ncbi:MAG: FprA family A-type flavoprotein [Prevotellaceae bacterium]|nr:FprA family A-type flavoprotein [Prevotellaceae bacterium]
MTDNQVAQGILYIGADDKDLDLFEGQYAIPEGISYNSYVILDEKIAIMDTIDARKTNEWLDNLQTALNGRQPDYLVVSHMEPDHSANIRRIMEMYPDVTVVCTALAQKLIVRFFGETPASNQMLAVTDGDTLSLGEHTLQFFTAPMVHWPEVMMTYEQKEQILFSADAFGKFGALSYDDPEGWACEARRYYFNIVGKYGAQVQAVLKKLSGLSISKICPLHGPILDDNLGYYLQTYNTWSSYEPEDAGIFIAYCSLHGNTEEAALKLASILKSDSDVKVATADLRRDDLHEAVEDAFRYDRVVLAAPTYDGGVMPVMEDFIAHLRAKNYQNRHVGIIENGSWAPVAGKVMREAMESLKNITIVEPIVTVESTVKPATVEALKELATALLNISH